MATNALARRWEFDVPNVNNLLQPIQQGIARADRLRQQDVENRRADEQMGMQRERFGMEKNRMAKADEAAEAQRIGGIARVIDGEKDPTRRAAMIQNLYKGSPSMVQALQKYGVDPNDHANVPKFLMAQAGGYDPLSEEAKRAQIESSRASAAASRANAGNIGMTDPIREYQFAKRDGFPGSFEDWKKQGQNNNASQNITWGRDEAGNWVPMQATRSGELVASRMPANVKPVPVPEMAEARAAATERGKAAGEAVVNLPTVENNARAMLDAIDGVERLPNLERMTGWYGNLPNVTPAARDAQAKIDQIQGQSFLQAFAGLRGGGQITEAEGAKATAALSRLAETRVGTPQYRQALADLRREVEALRDLARMKAQGGRRPLGGAQPAAPSGGGGAIPPGSYVYDPATGQLRPK